VSYYELSRLGVTFRPIDEWPGEPNPDRRWAPFRTSLSQTVPILARELRMLDARQVVIQVALEESDIRIDGFPKAGRRARHPGVILAFDSKWGPLKYATDEFTDWEDNLRAIALAMEALRKVDRYGVSKRGEQYRGWRALPTGSAGDDPVASLTREQAERLLESEGGWSEAVKKHHPDRGGDPDRFRLLVRARELVAG
jgi:hypothetical protein